MRNLEIEKKKKKNWRKKKDITGTSCKEWMTENRASKKQERERPQKNVAILSITID